MGLLEHKVIVYGVETQIGLSMIRELGKADCEVFAIAKSNRSIGLHSKYVKKGFVILDFSEDALIDQLNQIARETGAKHLLCVSETDIIFFNRIKHRLIDLLPLVPDMERMSKVLDKSQTEKAGKFVGIETPQTDQIKSMNELGKLIKQLQFPVILKWSNPLEVMTAARELGISIEKIEYCHSEQALVDKLSVFEPLGVFPMIQNYCPGYGLGQFFFRHNGEILLRFQHRRIHEWPPEGGVSTLCESVSFDQHQSLQAQSIKLLEYLDWEGVAMVEYRYDSNRDRAVLMEVNGRFWGSLPLAYQCKAPFSLYTYKVLGLGWQPDCTSSAVAGRRSQNTLAELKRLHRIIFHPKKIKDQSLTFNKSRELLGFLFGLVNPKNKHYVFEIGDPGPFFKDIKNMLSKLSKSNSFSLK